jgi:hypothetical protein
MMEDFDPTRPVAAKAIDGVDPKEFVPWQSAGGPNECPHGYAAGIPCPTCSTVESDESFEASEAILKARGGQ